MISTWRLTCGSASSTEIWPPPRSVLCPTPRLSWSIRTLPFSLGLATISTVLLSPPRKGRSGASCIRNMPSWFPSRFCGVLSGWRCGRRMRTGFAFSIAGWTLSAWMARSIAYVAIGSKEVGRTNGLRAGACCATYCIGFPDRPMQRRDMKRGFKQPLTTALFLSPGKCDLQRRLAPAQAALVVRSRCTSGRECRTSPGRRSDTRRQPFLRR